MNLKERYGDWALVTGASAGIGEAYAEYLASEGMNCVIVARRRDRLERLRTRLETGYGVTIRALAIDLTEDGFMAKLGEATADIAVSLLVNNAGFGASDYFINNGEGLDENMVRLNCLAPVILSRHYLPLMVGRGRGAVVYLSSIGAIQPSPGCATYSATKAFGMYLGNALSHELRMKGIDVLTVLPGITNTEFQGVAHFKTERKGRTPMDVVKTTFRALGKKSMVIDGFKNRVNSFLMGLFPGWLKISIAHAYMKNRSTKIGR